MTDSQYPQPMAGQFRKKPVVIEAIQFNGPFSYDELVEAWGEQFASSSVYQRGFLTIRTLEGDHFANIGDWIIKGIKGEFYPCKPDIFAATYEPAEVPAPEGEDERDAYVSWLSDSYPRIWPRKAAEHNWQYGHVSALAWQAGVAFAAQAAAIKPGLNPAPAEEAWQLIGASSPEEYAEFRRWVANGKPPIKPQPKGTVSEFTNELGNAIRITIEGPTSTSENVLTPMEAAKLRGALNEHAAQAPAPAPDDKALTQALEERDAASDYIDALLDEVLGADRHEWTSNYGHADAMAEVRERMSSLLQPMVDKAWSRFESAVEAPAVGADAMPVLRKLVEQIDKAEFVDENGHPIKMNVAYLAAKELL